MRGRDSARPAVLAEPALDGFRDPRAASRREHRLAPPEQVAGRLPAARDRAGRLRLPGELERPRTEQPALPVARREERRGPVPRQLVRPEEVRAPLVRLAPQELGRLAEVARLVEDEERLGPEVVEGRRRGEERRPDLGRVADGRGARFAAGPGPCRIGSLRIRRSGEPLEVVREALGQLPRRSRRAARAAPSPPSGGRRNSDAGSSTTRSTLPVVRWSVGSNARSESISSPNDSIRTGSSAEGGKTSTMPPRRANSPRPATSRTGV